MFKYLAGIGAGAGILGMLAFRDIVEDLPKHPSKTYKQRDPSQIDKIVIHHSAWPDGTPEDYAKLHIDTHDWAGIGYHFVIQKSGIIYQTNRISTQSNHVGEENPYAIGLCLTGNFEEEKPTTIQLTSAKALVAFLKLRYGIWEVGPHGRYRNTSCPGRYMPDF